MTPDSSGFAGALRIVMAVLLLGSCVVWLIVLAVMGDWSKFIIAVIASSFIRSAVMPS